MGEKVQQGVNNFIKPNSKDGPRNKLTNQQLKSRITKHVIPKEKNGIDSELNSY